MSKKLLIVESPAKAGTIKKYLGKDYTVVASKGHVIDLPKSRLAVDVDNDFEPRYITIRGKGDLLAMLKKEAKNADVVYLATDPDREGEAISWHLANALKIDINSNCRVTFNEITKNAVKEAIKAPRSIDMDLVNAQQARRVLDRIVGYKISPLLWEKVKRGLSAGRVQSVAARMICDREEEILNFVPEEYWSVEAELFKGKSRIDAKYFGQNGKEQKLSSGEEANGIIDAAVENPFVVSNVKKTEVKKNPPPPFTTSTLQQDALRKINFSTSRTMQNAQTLYEGINIGGKIGTVGLITYMRTDSLRISDAARSEAVAYVNDTFGEGYVCPRRFKAKKNAQDAHEAIRPTNVNITPVQIKDKLTPDQYKLYKLIWERFVASQMAAAVYDNMNIVASSGKYDFKASATVLKFDGFTAVYTEGSDEAKKKKDKKLPEVVEGDKLLLMNMEAKQHFTQPPARFTEATLVKALEENGIGRPSTYSPTIATIISRGYVTRSKKQLVPTELGSITTDIMKNNFKDIVDIEFTANMEKELDEVEEGKREWVKILRDFYPGFKKNLAEATEKIAKIQIKDEESDIECEKCGRKMVYKISKFGKFLACPGYPECKNTKPIRIETGAKCPKCGGELLEKRSRRGKVYYGCEKYPKCDFMLWDEPVNNEVCPECGGLLIKKNGRKKKIVCNSENCTYERDLKERDSNNG